MSSTSSTSTVIVTGAAGALGKAVARRFAEDGAFLLLVDVDAAALAQVHAATPDAVCIAANLGDAQDTSARLGAALEKHGPASVLCNIAGGFDYSGDAHAADAGIWQRMFDMNVATLVNASRAVVPGMLSAGRGKIVNVAAASAASGKAGMAPYVASKSAVARITESMALELRDRGINVNAVAPSILDTPANRSAMPEADFTRWVPLASLAAAIRFLASDEAADIHGAILPVTGRV
ncbi:SDR family NAD(P)-dependent oxidoreductase [Fulvimonas soli]|uniref:Short subunit dehydrogenase n=1 Tax=Fulvimonas soli TaxID=155197 RepID=A0A316IE34_9GAMM|nr:SDR family NAD(P)-dependent oxidoreductase [Fulvimonas soli]PWK91897.1 short subunit dehydrogenase [Fulvimonas soli]TNY26024.1 3-oxoacyl-ACP reductase [Fulvimonas soli]